MRRVTLEVEKDLHGEPRPGSDHDTGANPWASMSSDHFASSAMTAAILAELDPGGGATGAPEGLPNDRPNISTMSLPMKSFVAILASLLAAGALLVVGVAGSAALPISENPNPTTEECQPGQPYNENCRDVVTFAFPKQTTVESGKFELVHLGCNQSCNHVIFTVKHGDKLVAKGVTYPHGNYLPIISASVTPFAKKQLRRLGKLQAYAHVCVHPPGPETFCKGADILLRAQ